MENQTTATPQALASAFGLAGVAGFRGAMLVAVGAASGAFALILGQFLAPLAFERISQAGGDALVPWAVGLTALATVLAVALLAWRFREEPSS